MIDWPHAVPSHDPTLRSPCILRKPPKIPLLTALISGSAIAYYLFLPSILDIGVSIFTVQTTLIAFLVAYALAQFFYGGVSDRFERRPTLLWGLAIYVIASLICAFATSMTMLLLARILQRIGAAGSIVMVRLIVRDLYDRKNSARALAVISTVMVFAPATGPAIGGYLTPVSVGTPPSSPSPFWAACCPPIAPCGWPKPIVPRVATCSPISVP